MTKKECIKKLEELYANFEADLEKIKAQVEKEQNKKENHED